MGIKRRLINTLPPAAKQALAYPYDYYQTRTADRRFIEGLGSRLADPLLVVTADHGEVHWEQSRSTSTTSTGRAVSTTAARHTRPSPVSRC